MHIAYVSASLGIPLQGPSGASAHIRDLVTALRRRHKTDLFVPRLTDHRGFFGPIVEAVETGVVGWPSWLRSWREFREVRVARRLARQALRVGGPWDVVIERHSLFSDAGQRLARHRNIPHILEVNAPLVEERRRFEQILKPSFAHSWEQDVLQAADIVVTVSAWLKNWAEQEIGCSNVVHIPNAVCLLEGDPNRGRMLLGLSDERPIVGFVGSMKPWHGLDFLAEVMPNIDAHFVCVGHGEVPAGMRQILAYEPQKLADVVSAFSVGVAPYRVSAPPWFSPLKILQYRAQGIPVVASNIGDCEMLMAQCGKLVSADDCAAWVSAIREEIGKLYPKTTRSWLDAGEEMLALVGQQAGNALH